MKEHLQHFYAGWETELSGKVYGDSLVDLVGEVFERRRRLEDECLKTHPIAGTHALERCAEFESYAGALVSALADLRRAIDAELQRPSRGLHRDDS